MGGLAGEQVVGVSAGTWHTTAVTVDGRAFSWGGNDYGQLGHGDTQSQLTPKQIAALAGHRIVHVDAGRHGTTHTTTIWRSRWAS